MLGKVSGRRPRGRPKGSGGKRRPTLTLSHDWSDSDLSSYNHDSDSEWDPEQSEGGHCWNRKVGIGSMSAAAVERRGGIYQRTLRNSSLRSGENTSMSAEVKAAKRRWQMRRRREGSFCSSGESGSDRSVEANGGVGSRGSGERTSIDAGSKAAKRRQQMRRKSSPCSSRESRSDLSAETNQATGSGRTSISAGSKAAKRSRQMRRRRESSSYSSGESGSDWSAEANGVTGSLGTSISAGSKAAKRSRQMRRRRESSPCSSGESGSDWSAVADGAADKVKQSKRLKQRTIFSSSDSDWSPRIRTRATGTGPKRAKRQLPCSSTDESDYRAANSNLQKRMSRTRSRARARARDMAGMKCWIQKKRKDEKVTFTSGTDDSSSESEWSPEKGSDVDSDWTSPERRGRNSKKGKSPKPSSDEFRLDEYLLCDDCDVLYHGDCPTHGPLERLDKTSGWDRASLTHTSVPVPSQLTVKPSTIPGAGLGVFATQFVPKRVQVGPYEGKRVAKQDVEDMHDNEYSWEIRSEHGIKGVVDGSDPAHSNWLRFVNCARNEEEQNMLAFQYHGEIYYRTVKDVYPGTELLLWYGDQYAEELQISTEEGVVANHRCLGCGCRFVKENSLQLHLKHSKRCAQASPQTFTCRKCSRPFSNLEALQHHVRRHILLDSIGVCRRGQAKSAEPGSNCSHTRKCFRCDYCGKCYSANSTLTNHLRTHSGDKPYRCKYCGMRFTDNCGRNKHLMIHLNNKKFKCEHCGKAFIRSCHLTQHLHTHSVDKPHKCKECGMGFSRAGDLQRHARSHWGDKPFRCEHCGKRFVRSCHLSQHRCVHDTEDKHFKCEECGQTFGLKSSLQRHLRNFHT